MLTAREPVGKRLEPRCRLVLPIQHMTSPSWCTRTILRSCHWDPKQFHSTESARSNLDQEPPISRIGWCCPRRLLSADCAQTLTGKDSPATMFSNLHCRNSNSTAWWHQHCKSGPLQLQTIGWWNIDRCRGVVCDVEGHIAVLPDPNNIPIYIHICRNLFHTPCSDIVVCLFPVV